MHVEIQKLVVYMMEESFKIPDKAGKMCVDREARPYTLIGRVRKGDTRMLSWSNILVI